VTTGADLRHPVRVLAPADRPAVRLICFPYAGGGLAPFRAWRLGPRVEIVGVVLPGREDRFAEPPFERMTAVLDWLDDRLAGHLDGPFALFGHSMGARIAYGYAHRLRERGGPAPERLFVSGSPGPCLPVKVGGWNEPDSGLVRWLRLMDGTPAEILANRPVLEALLPTLRADLTVVATWPYERRPALDVPIHAFAGADDGYAGPERMAHWEVETAAGFRLSTLPGGHFFLTERRDALLAAIGRDLDRVTGGDR
jgi:surfactin synthase thioesterase subunit